MAHTSRTSASLDQDPYMGAESNIDYARRCLLGSTGPRSGDEHPGRDSEHAGANEPRLLVKSHSDLARYSSSSSRSDDSDDSFEAPPPRHVRTFPTTGPWQPVNGYYKCNQCGKTFDTLQAVQQHIRNAHQCAFEGCEKLYRIPQSRARHMRETHGDCIPCRRKCGAIFTRPSNMERHANDNCPNKL